MGRGTTLVCSLYMGVNKYRSIEDYIRYGRKLLGQSANKIIYIEREVYDMYYGGELWDSSTIFRYITESDVYLKAYDSAVTEFNIITTNSAKDTRDYMYLMCNKTEWMRRAMDEDPYGSENFVWLDFGVYHMIGDDAVFNACVKNLCDKEYDRVRIAGGNKSGGEDNRMVNWFFLGSIFGGNKSKLLLFCDKMKARCIAIIEKEKRIYWEVNIWYDIWVEVPEIFSVYLANHDASILRLY